MSNPIVLCAGHARQIMRDRVMPVDACNPAESWENGYGQRIVCDWLVRPEAIHALVASEPRRWTENRRQAETRRQLAAITEVSDG